MTICTDANGREFTYNEYSKKVYLDEKRPHADHLIRHKWLEEKPESSTYVLIRRMNFFDEPRNHVAWYTEKGEFHVSGYDKPVDGITHRWELPEVSE